jgi:hypothetical protein
VESDDEYSSRLQSARYEDTLFSAPVYADDHHPATGHMHGVMHSDPTVIAPEFRETCLKRASNYVEVVPERVARVALAAIAARVRITPRTRITPHTSRGDEIGARASLASHSNTATTSVILRHRASTRAGDDRRAAAAPRALATTTTPAAATAGRSSSLEVTRLSDGAINIENQYNFGVQTPGPGVYDLPLADKPVMLISHALGEGKSIDPKLVRGTANHARAHPLYSGWNVMAQLSLRLVQVHLHRTHDKQESTRPSSVLASCISFFYLVPYISILRRGARLARCRAREREGSGKGQVV